MLKLLPLPNLRARALTIAVCSIICLLIAYIGQWKLELRPCILCLYQRYVYGILFLITSLSLFFNTNSLQAHNTILMAAKLVLFTGLCIAAYNVGVEEGVFHGLASCQVSQTYQTIEELKALLVANNNAPCRLPAFTLFGISLAGYNCFIFILLLSLTNPPKNPQVKNVT